MATFLDFSILGSFTSIFTFLLVFVIVFGLLETFKMFGEEHRGLNAIIALCIGFILLFSKGVVAVIQTFFPWFTLLILVVFLMIFAARMFGLSEGDVKAGFYNNPFMTWILIFGVLILLFSLGAGFGQTTLEAGQNQNLTTPEATVTTTGQNATAGATNTLSFSQNLYNTIFHPKVLGMILIMLVVILAMLFLTTREGP